MNSGGKEGHLFCGKSYKHKARVVRLSMQRKKQRQRLRLAAYLAKPCCTGSYQGPGSVPVLLVMVSSQAYLEIFKTPFHMDVRFGLQPAGSC